MIRTVAEVGVPLFDDARGQTHVVDLHDLTRFGINFHDRVVIQVFYAARPVEKRSVGRYPLTKSSSVRIRILKLILGNDRALRHRRRGGKGAGKRKKKRKKQRKGFSQHKKEGRHISSVQPFGFFLIIAYR